MTGLDNTNSSGVTGRARLANRRRSLTVAMAYNESLYAVSGGFDDAAALREVFLSGAKEGSAMEAILGDAAVLISIALQHGVPLADLAKSMGRVRLTPLMPRDLDLDAPRDLDLDAPGARGDSVPASPIGATLDLLATLQVHANGDVESGA